MKTLYVSDLDGTLLRRDKTVSDFTVKTINELTAQGMLFFLCYRALLYYGEPSDGGHHRPHSRDHLQRCFYFGKRDEKTIAF